MCPYISDFRGRFLFLSHGMLSAVDAAAAALHCNAARIKLLRLRMPERNFFSIGGCVPQLHSTRFSLPEDVVRFSGLIHLTPDQSSSLADERNK
jgi:hypothetical protein